MTTISPLLQNRLNSTNNKKQAPNNRHEKIYQDLKKRAHEAKPNEAKAKMVDEGILGNPITAIKDTFKDGKNFVKTIATGEMGDNNLGRINDLGLKVGAGLIATFLALHSKTKTQSIMRFVGGATFIAMMDLWPKLFINLPARLVHGFRIDRKYISAQGDKKDFFLDNQFLVWDAYPEEQLRKDAKKAGIDYDSENGKEKIQRKMQKTALQNRTLWMATAGFATPLLTAMAGNFIEPVVEKAVVENSVKKVESILGENGTGIKAYLNNASENAKASKAEMKALNSILEAYKDGKMSYEDMIEALSDKFSLARLFETFKDEDDMKVLDGYHPQNLVSTLEEMYDAHRTIDEKGIREAIVSINAVLTDSGFETISQKDVLDKIGKDFSISHVLKVLEEFELNKEEIALVLEKSKVDEAKFFEQIKQYYSGPFTQLKARVKAYVDLINPLIGSKAESLQTLEFKKTMEEIIKTLEINPNEIKEITKTLKDNNGNTSDITTKIIKLLSGKISDLDKAKLDELIKSLSSKDFDNRIDGLIKKLLESTDEIKVDDNPLTSAILGIAKDNKGNLNVGNKKGIASVIENFVKKKATDIKAIKSKLIIIANLEKRIKNGDFPGEEELVKKYVYDSGIPIITFPKRADTVGHAKFKKLLEEIFDSEKFEDPNMKKIVDNIKKIGIENSSVETPTIDYMSCGSFADHIKKFSTRLANNKTWMKIFAPMTIALIAITLLVQPLFGKIDKEFPEEKNGGAK